MLDQNAEGFGAERFPQENRVVADLVRRIGELEGDQRQLAGETQGLADKQEAAVERKLRDRIDEVAKRIDEKAERLRQRLAAVPAGDPDGALAESLGQAKEDAKRLRRSLKEKDLGEARTEVERATAAIDEALEGLENARPSRRKKDEETRQKAAAGLGEARAVAEDIAKDIAGSLPRGEETLSADERGQSQSQAKKQQALGDRAQELARDAARRLGRMPGLEDAEGDLRGAAEDMQRASEHLGRSEPKQAEGAEKDAADRLAKLRDSLQERTMGADGGGRQNRDPVRIPGVDESQAPRAWRQELMDAMKEKAPDRFRDDVRRYYEELVR